VLVVDDEPEVREIAVAILTKSGFSVFSADDGMDALTKVREAPQSVDCVLLDVTMPRMDGFETYRELRSLRPDLPVIFSSGYTDRVIRRIAEEAAGSGYLHKPWEPELLVTAVRKAVRAGSGDGRRLRA
jgi:CheY-like chemotaxis protein